MDIEDQTALEQNEGAIDLDSFPDFDMLLSPISSNWISEFEISSSKTEFDDEFKMEFPLLTQEETKEAEKTSLMQHALPPLSPSKVQNFSLKNTKDIPSSDLHFPFLNGDEAAEQSGDDMMEEETIENEMELLEKEAKYLDAQMDFFESCAKSGHRVGIKAKLRARQSIEQRLKLLKSQGENQLLHDLITQQRVYVESIKAMLALSPVNEVRMALMTPMESYIHLGKDFIERKQTILSLRKEKLDMTYKFIEHKSHGIDCNQPYQFSDMFDKFGKHYCMHFAISKYDGVSVFQAARAIYEQYTEEDEALNHALGTTAKRESFGTIRCNFMHQHIVSHVNGDNKDWKNMPEMESNGIFFCRFGENSAVLTTDYVDQDDLHPYDTKNRIRRDTSIGVVLSGHEDDDGEKFVVMKRFSMTKLHMHPHKVSQKQQNRFFHNMQ
ncbi:hypothetical protein BBP00_00009170 [Phytophthora kernoviae]|uniref:Uncharacterized protein n=1 Tax=Phytophthora kernoviae TaxID=325452 RepID=A0A3F2RDC9_9STRA|nr:hypothetical protein BBP00_00009170 [Phytophthora kernoviae]